MVPPYLYYQLCAPVVIPFYLFHSLVQVNGDTCIVTPYSQAQTERMPIQYSAKFSQLPGNSTNSLLCDSEERGPIRDRGIEDP